MQFGHVVLPREGQEQTQGGFLCQVFPAQGPLVGQEVGDRGGEVVVHDNTSSPSPRATSRSASTATLA
jgi:hypothetical protein